MSNVMSGAPTLEFPQSLADKYLPKRIDDFVGLQGPKTVLSKFVANPYPSAWLFVGPSGTGKPTMALAMAEQIPAELRHVPSRDCNLQTVQDVTYHCHFFPWAVKKMHLVLVDEANEMTPPAQDAWLSKLDATDRPPNTVFVFTCNETYRLADRFQSRCRVLRFAEEQPEAEVAAMLQKIWTLENGGSLAPNFNAIVRESSGNIRSSLMKLELALLGLRPPGCIPESVPQGKQSAQPSCETCGAVVLPRRRFCDPCYSKRTAMKRCVNTRKGDLHEVPRQQRRQDYGRKACRPTQ